MITCSRYKVPSDQRPGRHNFNPPPRSTTPTSGLFPQVELFSDNLRLNNRPVYVDAAVQVDIKPPFKHVKIVPLARFLLDRARKRNEKWVLEKKEKDEAEAALKDKEEATNTTTSDPLIDLTSEQAEEEELE